MAYSAQACVGFTVSKVGYSGRAGNGSLRMAQKTRARQREATAAFWKRGQLRLRAVDKTERATGDSKVAPFEEVYGKYAFSLSDLDLDEMIDSMSAQ